MNSETPFAAESEVESDIRSVIHNWHQAVKAGDLDSGVWKIAHEHFSVPFDLHSSKAMFDLKP